MSQFDIIFRGDIVFGQQLADVKLRLQQLFKSDAARIDALFTGRPVPLKRNLDEVTANKYRDALLKAGAMVEVCPSDRNPANASAKPSSAVTPASAPARGIGWTLAPVGADLLPTGERPPPPAPVVVDITGLSLRPAEGNLLDAAEIHPDETPAVVAPDLGVAAVGAMLISADEKCELPVLEIELEDWEVAEPGSDLLAEDERPVVVPAMVAVEDFGLAPVGSSLGQLKPEVKPVTPDISKIRLVD